ncbi:transglutaminase domain-containing protein [Butyrivibrio sp. MC2021]|uniref:transglutaminase domain-containing protein n=1 Tax=Butyrivibrio sp. MC2021 TaxID=1408306 RepID=UPI0004786D43|nr:transglutaminase domain-containing protein [Butyrivibrio sp. MC2021]
MKRALGLYNRILAAALAFFIGTLIFGAVSADAYTVTVIDSATFNGNSKITTVHIGSDVYEITSGAFRNLINLRSITVSENNPYYSSYSNCLYDKEMTELLCFPAALSGASIPETVVSIRENALYGVADALKKQIKAVIENQAMDGATLSEIPGEHFVYTENGLMWRKADGSLIKPESDLMKQTAALIEACTSKNMGQKQALKRSFDFLVQAVSYERSMETPTGNWTGSYALNILETGKGNCYNYAAAFAYIAKGLGYETKVCTGTVTSSLGGRTPHAWTEVKMGDEWFIFDAEMQDAKGGGYYKQTYGSYPAKPLEKSAAYTIIY